MCACPRSIVSRQPLFPRLPSRPSLRLELPVFISLVELIVEMHEWATDGEYDRTGIEEQEERILDVPIGRIRLPIRPGRNVASIVEVAARNHLLKLQGHNAAKKFQESLERRLAAAELGKDGE